ncbi:MAG: hypothetical protein AB7F78_06345 [Hyphomicrobiaceae bacterium]
MLPRIVLLVVQVAAAWFLGEAIKQILPPILGRPYDIYLYAAIYAVIIMVVGFSGSLVLKNVRVPTAATFIASLVLALILATVTLFPQITTPVQDILPLLRGNARLYPFLGALAGYLLKR